MTLPPFSGLEVDMLSLGNADAILVTQWTGSNATRVLIDGGHAADADEVLKKLAELRVAHLHHLVCTHPHDDHAAGLVQLLNNKQLTVGQLWMHLPWTHINYEEFKRSLGQAEQSKVVNVIRASLDTTQELYRVAVARNIPISEPFDKSSIGPLFVCGPTLEFYRNLLVQFGDFERLKNFESARAAHELKLMIEDFARGTAVGGQPLAEDDGDLGSEPTEPENESSVILTASHNANRLLFTADAGVSALQSAVSRYQLNNLNWMQIPHHGSRRNLTETLVEYFKPTYAFVSANGSTRHPRRKVVNAFKKIGTKVYSTHHPTPRSLHHSVGSVPERKGYEKATEL